MGVKILKPLGEYLIAKKAQAETRSAGGLHLPDNMNTNEVQGIVVSVGPDVDELQEGDRIVWEIHCGHSIRATGESLIILKQKDVWSKVEDGN